MRQPSGFHRRLFLIYSAILLTVVASSFIAFYLYASRQQQTIYNHSFERELSAYVDRVDNAVLAADRQLTQIKSHTDIEIYFYTLSISENAYRDLQENAVWLRTFRDKIYAISALDTQVFRRVTVYSKSGVYAGTGYNYPEVDPERIRERLAPLQRFFYDDSFRLVRYPASDLLEPDAPPVVSIMRKITYSGLAHSIAEIQLPGEFFVRIASATLPTPGDRLARSLYVYGTDRRWHPILEAEGSSVRQRLPDRPDDFPAGYVGKDRSSLLFVQRSDITGWSYAMVLPSEPLHASLRGLSAGVLLLGLLVSAVGLFLIHLSTKRALLPLHRLRRAMTRVDLAQIESDAANSLFKEGPDELAIQEIQDLHHSFVDMLTRLQQSRLEATNAREAELKARLVAMQKQTDPHFLYNTLSLIGMLGFDQGDENILALCSSLVSMFKYVTYGDSHLSTLGEELRHLNDYLRIMRIRHQEKLEYEFSVPDEMLQLVTPKLFLQPLAENAIKHGFADAQSEWRITVLGEAMDDGWRLEMKDNGSGFSGEERERLSDLWRALQAGAQPEAGHGLANTMARLRFQYGDAVDFRIGEVGGGGASIRIAVTTQRREEMQHENCVG